MLVVNMISCNDHIWTIVDTATVIALYLFPRIGVRTTVGSQTVVGMGGAMPIIAGEHVNVQVAGGPAWANVNVNPGYLFVFTMNSGRHPDSVIPQGYHTITATYYGIQTSRSFYVGTY